jgi:hypothetical protein
MNLKDNYTRVILTIIAILLALVLLRPQSDILVQNAEARTSGLQARALDATLIKKVPAEGLRNVVVLGDGKTFVLQQKDQVMIYRVDYIVK